jgi:hypothetical protein
MVIVFSDLFDEPRRSCAASRRSRSAATTYVVFHVLDKDEVEFPFERMTLFQGLEQLPELLVDPRSLKDAYLK